MSFSIIISNNIQRNKSYKLCVRTLRRKLNYKMYNEYIKEKLKGNDRPGL